jgi:methionyl aminopeptidase
MTENKKLEDWKKAGKIAAEALEYGRLLINKGAKMLDVCEKIDDKIKNLGGRPAFPSQISLNSTAAHFCPGAKDEIILTDQIAKLDVGVEVNGAIGDTACTVDLSGKNTALVNASRDALESAIRIIKPGTKIREIGKAISETINEAGFTPIVNLSGHGLEEYDIHAMPTIPNIDNGDETTIKEGMIFAIEPFATNGRGRVQEAGASTIFAQADSKPVRDGREILKQIEQYKGMPFTTRWIKGTEMEIRLALRNFQQQGILIAYPPLADAGKGIVSQAEHTVLVTKNGCEVLTVLH